MWTRRTSCTHCYPCMLYNPVEESGYERCVFANPMMSRSTSSKISQQQQYSCLPRYFSRLMDQITRGRAYIISTGREDFIPTAVYDIYQDSNLFASLQQLIHSFLSWLVWGRNQVYCEFSSAQAAHKLVINALEKQKTGPRSLLS